MPQTLIAIYERCVLTPPISSHNVFIHELTWFKSNNIQQRYHHEIRANLQGSLRSNGDLKHKHVIRQFFHPQLKQQWANEPSLQEITKNPPSTDVNAQMIANSFLRNGFRFLPLVLDRFHLVCYLEILLLRREAPGQLFHGGDIDGRLKTLLDSLRVPDEDQLRSLTPQPDEDPFYCLLEDDRFLTGLQVKTERLLAPPPPEDNHARNNVELVLMVTVRPTTVAPHNHNINFLGG